MDIYNYFFDISAVVFNLVFMVLLSSKKRMTGRRYKYFYYLVMTMFLASVGELCTALVRQDIWLVSNGWKTAINVFASFFHNSIGFLLYMYILHIFGIFRHLSMKTRWIISIPEMVITAFMVLPPLRKMLFYYDAAGIYHQGEYQNLIYWGVIVIYGAAALFAVMLYRKYILKSDFYTVFFVSAGLVGSILAENIVHSIHLNISIFLQSLCLLIAFVKLENASEIIDGETGLLSRIALWNDASLLYNSNYSAFLILIDLSNLDYYSRIIGGKRTDNVLKNISSWLMKFADNKTNVYHIKRETFAVLLYDYSKEETLQIANNIRYRFERGWNSDNIAVSFQTIVKATGIPEQIANEDQLYAFLENDTIGILSMENVNFVDEVKTDERNLDIEMAINRAIADNTLKVFYQPIYNVKSKEINSCEALVRMHDEKLGDVSPEEFIRVAEKTGQIEQIGEYVFESVCKFLKDNNPRQYGLDYVEVNLSTVECMNPLIARNMQATMDKYDVDRSQIDFEITETAVVHNDNRMNNMMNILRNQGLSFALDDFGTGNANYSYLVNYNFDIIKVDKSFLWAADDDDGNVAVLNSMIQLIHGLNRKAVVEGVETEKQRDYLISKEVDYLQGFLFSKPIPEHEFMEYLREFNSINFESERSKSTYLENDLKKQATQGR